MTIWVVIGVYALFMLGIGVWYSRKVRTWPALPWEAAAPGVDFRPLLRHGLFLRVMFIGYSGGSGWSYGLWERAVGVGNAVFGTLLAWLVLANRTRT